MLYIKNRGEGAVQTFGNDFWIFEQYNTSDCTGDVINSIRFDRGCNAAAFFGFDVYATMSGWYHPTKAPTDPPTQDPTLRPSLIPTQDPTLQPSLIPTSGMYIFIIYLLYIYYIYIYIL